MESLVKWISRREEQASGEAASGTMSIWQRNHGQFETDFLVHIKQGSVALGKVGVVDKTVAFL